MKPLSNFIKDADSEANVGINTAISDLAIRINPKTAKKASDEVKQALNDLTLSTLRSKLYNEEFLMSSLDDYAINLVIHSIAKSIDIHSDDCKTLFKHDSILLTYQDESLNTPLHYLADRGMDLFGLVSTKWLLIRNEKGATVIHLLAKNPSLAKKIEALPPSILALKTKNGISVQDTMLSATSPKGVDLKTLSDAVNKATARAPRVDKSAFDAIKTFASKIETAKAAARNAKLPGSVDTYNEFSTEPTAFHKAFYRLTKNLSSIKFAANTNDLHKAFALNSTSHLYMYESDDALFSLLTSVFTGIYFFSGDSACAVINDANDSPIDERVSETRSSEAFSRCWYFYAYKDESKAALMTRVELCDYSSAFTVVKTNKITACIRTNAAHLASFIYAVTEAVESLSNDLA